MGQIGRGAQLEERGFLLAGDLDGFQEASFRALSIQRGKRNSPSTRCKSASQRAPDCSTKAKARLQVES